MKCIFNTQGYYKCNNREYFTNSGSNSNEKPSWQDFRALMLKQEGVGLRNAKGDTDTLSINDSSELSNILPKYCCENWNKLTEGIGGTWDVGTSNYLFQDTYNLPLIDWKSFYKIIEKNLPLDDKTKEYIEVTSGQAGLVGKIMTELNVEIMQKLMD